jgi:hypothetical protein
MVNSYKLHIRLIRFKEIIYGSLHSKISMTKSLENKKNLHAFWVI